MTQELFEKYIEPYTWKGDLYFDEDGWGDKNAVMNKLCKVDTVAFGNIPEDVPSVFLASPMSENCPVYIPGEANASFRVVNTRYEVIFYKLDYEEFMKKLNEIANLSEKQISIILKSYVKNESKHPHEEIFSLIIRKEKDKPFTFKMVKGRWVPCFDRCEAVAEWAHDNTNNDS